MSTKKLFKIFQFDSKWPKVTKKNPNRNFETAYWIISKLTQMIKKYSESSKKLFRIFKLDSKWPRVTPANLKKTQNRNF
jgi:hypothetical protein